jgi:hypothetical protein
LLLPYRWNIEVYMKEVTDFKVIAGAVGIAGKYVRQLQPWSKGNDRQGPWWLSGTEVISPFPVLNFMARIISELRQGLS